MQYFQGGWITAPGTPASVARGGTEVMEVVVNLSGGHSVPSSWTSESRPQYPVAYQ